MTSRANVKTDGAPYYCKPCGEFLLPEQPECPFCGQMAVPVDELPDGVGCPECYGDCHCSPTSVGCPFRKEEPCPVCKGWGVGNVNDYSIAPCPVCMRGHDSDPFVCGKGGCPLGGDL
jgi:hypothetical protein